MARTKPMCGAPGCTSEAHGELPGCWPHWTALPADLQVTFDEALHPVLSQSLTPLTVTVAEARQDILDWWAQQS